MYTILAALSGALLAICVTDAKDDYTYFWPIGLLFVSIYSFIKGAEKFTDALDEDDVDKYLSWLLVYNLGTICLFFGVATFLIMHFKPDPKIEFLGSLPFLYIHDFAYYIFLLLASCASFKWVKDSCFLLFQSEEEYEQYRRELLGEVNIEPDHDRFMKLHKWIRKILKNSTIGMTLKFRDILIELKPSSIDGVGVFAARNLNQGDFVAEGLHEEDYRTLVPWSAYLQLDDSTKKKIDGFCVGTPEGFIPPGNNDFNRLSVDWYFNHSCKGNLGFNDEGDFIATKNVKLGEELTYDYGLVESNPNFRMECKCRVVNCRKMITGNDWKNPEFRERHLKYMLPKLRREQI